MGVPRTFFRPREEEGVYLHLYNHAVSSKSGGYPFGDEEKRQFIKIIERFLIKYNIALIAMTQMDNHFHLLVHALSKRLTPAQAVKAYAKFHDSKKELEENNPRILNLIKHSNNFSEFMREIQRSFAIWFNNKEKHRKGAVWRGRFGSQVIQSDLYLWSCLEYIELNPVRAGICRDPAKYKYSTFGRWSDTGEHPYKPHFMKHILNLVTDGTSLEEFKSYMHSKMKLTILHDALKREAGEVARQRLMAAIEKEASTLHNFDMEVVVVGKNNWKSQKVIGSKEFVKNYYEKWEIYQNSG